MTCKSREAQSSDSEKCGLSETVPSNMEQMMRKMFAGCSSMMAEKMRASSPCVGEHAPEEKTDQQPQDVTRSMAGCGCGPMMARMLGECFEGETSKAGAQD